MRYLVTGGAGFIGSHIVEELVNLGEEVRVLDNLYSGKVENIKEFMDGITFIKGDIRDTDTVKKAVKGVNVILHQAAVPSVPRSVAEPKYTNDVNVNGTLELLVAARDEKIERFVYASSSSVYGDTPTLPKVENMTPQPLSPYAAQKLMGEHYARVFHGVYGLPTLGLRYFNIFGPRQDPNSEYAAVVPKFITKMLEKEAPIIYGDGEQSRDFTFVKNAVRANLLAVKSEDGFGESMNISTGERLTVNELSKIVGEIVGVDIEPIHDPPRDGDVKHSLGDIKKAKRLIGYDVEIDFKEGISRTVKSYQ
jgi:UDP-glucose 4-epimerase